MTRNENRSGTRAGLPSRKAKAPGAVASQETAESKAGRQRVAKLMARVGLCSRRDAEAWILEGRVSLNGALLTSPAVDVGPEDQVLVDGAPLPAREKTRLFLFHKPAALITSDHDPEGRETVHDYLRQHWPDGPRVMTIGRLDYNTEGLLLLTNDGGLARLLELPRTGWVRRYRVRAKGETNQAVLDGLRTGVSVDGVDYAGIEAKLDRIQGANCWLTMGLREGKNREVKRVLEHIGLEVNRLIRLSFGPFQLLDLAEGAVEEVKTRVLREQLGPALAEAAGADFGEAEPTAAIVAPPRPVISRPARASAGREQPPGRGRPEHSTGRDRATRPSDRRPAPGGRNARDEVPDGPPAIREKPVAGPRRHVSALRADAGGTAGPRKRLERTDTTDRKNRTVAVERLVKRAAPAASRRDAERRPRRGVEEAAPSRAQRGSQSAQGKRERIARSGAPRAERGEPQRPRSAGGERPVRQAREPRADGAKTRIAGARAERARPEFRRDGPARGEGEARAPRRFEGKPPRGRSDEARPTRFSGGGEGRPAEKPTRTGKAGAPRGAKGEPPRTAKGSPRGGAKSLPRSGGKSLPRGGAKGGKPARGGSPASRRPADGARPPRAPRR